VELGFIGLNGHKKSFDIVETKSQDLWLLSFPNIILHHAEVGAQPSCLRHKDILDFNS
jgi:hypothetical protein